MNTTELYYTETERKYKELKEACFVLLDNIKNRYPEEKRTEWKCQDMWRISSLIDFK